MRNLLHAAIAVFLASSLPALAGCASQVTPDPGDGGGGEGASTKTTDGGGGSGGSDCVEEVCDGADNDCDGEIDEGCECLPGDAEACYSGPAGTEGVGPCAPGARACDPETNTFGACSGDVVPATEVCNGQDDDCNGAADDLPDLLCGVGGCLAMAPACVGGQPGVCTPGAPAMEICDGIDNDCDQLTDEAFPESGSACDTGQLGVCSAGVSECVAGVIQCTGTNTPSGETCDGKDNNCDGTVDNGIPGTGGMCTTGALGVCAAGTISCQGDIVDCFPDVPASPEVCDGLDNDCDGASDEDDAQGGAACDTGLLGVCQQGTVHCVNGALVCQPNALAQVEVCDGADNNCDGQIDEGSPGAGQPCSCGGTSVCQTGQLFCQGCTKEVDCNNNIDDDGDGAVDCADTQCALGCGAPITACQPGQKLLVLSSTDIPKSIVDSTSVNSVMTFTETAVVKRVVLRFNITHTFTGDLDISLKSPANSTVDVTSDNGASGDNYTNTSFSDICPSPVASGIAPFNGCYSPEQPFSVFVDQPLNGVWTLTVADDAGGDVGSLSAWTLAMCVQ